MMRVLDPALRERLADLEDRNWWFVGMRGIARALLADVEVDLALDVGCGTGGNVRLLREVAGRVVALDESPEALRDATRGPRPPDAGVRANAMALPFRDGAFGLVFVWNVVEHLDDDARAMQEAARVLRPGGRVFVATSASMLLWSDHDVANHHRRRYSRAGLRRVVESAGLRVVRITHANAVPFLPAVAIAAAHRLRARTIGRPPVRDAAIEVGASVDAVLGFFLRAEALLLPRLDLPFGVSLLAICEKG